MLTYCIFKKKNFNEQKLDLSMLIKRIQINCKIMILLNCWQLIFSKHAFLYFQSVFNIYSLTETILNKKRPIFTSALLPEMSNYKYLSLRCVINTYSS